MYLHSWITDGFLVFLRYMTGFHHFPHLLIVELAPLNSHNPVSACISLYVPINSLVT